MEFNWERFLYNSDIVVHCSTEEQAKDFLKRARKHGLKWNSWISYSEDINWEQYKEKTCYTSYGTYSGLDFCKAHNYTILEWSDYEKGENMNLELSNLTDEQKKQIIDLAEKFKQENEVDKLKYDKDFCAITCGNKAEKVIYYTNSVAQDFFNLGLTAHTKEEAEKIRRRLLVEKELRDWAKKCNEPVDWESKQAKYCIGYDNNTKEIILNRLCDYTNGNIIFTDNEIGKQVIESIGQERLIRDYFGV